MKTSVWTSATLIAVLAAAGCTNDEKKAAPTPASTAPQPPATAPPAAATPPQTPTAPAPTATATSPTDGIEGVGSFKSIDAYCKDATSKFVAKACESATDQGANMCSCGPGKDVIRGKREIGPLPEATGLASAQLLLVERSAAGRGDCDLAIETANGRDWFVVPALMPCKHAPVSHDSSTWITVSGFDVTREDDVDVLTLAWTETTSSQDVDGKETKRDEKFTTRCTIGASTPPRCGKPTKL
ncbi:hypothetical protein [Nannocystis sp. SCPEA4]|uniref:hypothetical protein n=1 Tax=Nannocystis sp. SCPEA4 TaxID=2996787 RepID=UPI00226FA049|nr:hypothetical protein [Nannocystis sp. SCPEA4]MCY1059542.1 hypothetical protein [Nannocystis sp. SCPEA4]